MLCSAVKTAIDLNQQVENGGTKLEHLRRIARQTRKVEIPEVRIPVAGTHIWEWFWELSSRRQQGFGIAPISFQEINAWVGITKPLIHDFELKILLDMDRAFLDFHYELNQNKKE